MIVVLVLSLGAAAFFGAADFVGGLASRKVEALTIALASQALGLVLFAAVVPALPGARLQGADLVWGVSSGVSSGIAIALLYRALAAGTMSIVAPITAVTSAAVPVALGLSIGERPGRLALVGVVVALVAIALVSRSSDDPTAGRTRTAGVVLFCAFGAGFSFGVTFFLLSRTSEQAGLWPLLGARSAAVTVLVITWTAVSQRDLITKPLRWRGVWGYFKTFQGAGGPLERRPFQHGASGLDMAVLVWAAPLAALTAALDVSANVLFLFAVHQGMVSLVAVLTSLTPVSTVLLAQVVLRERISLVQVIGLGTAAVAVTLIALG